ncbi:MAG TPA: glycerophosphodiester phosphodiesterase [Candidatus Saccharimonadales bacterium]|nr:glycerophosphodiester phosphodiesterase [Candidatus Saccharimonadales bacterium]
MQIIGHRGAAGLALENTLASFKAAINAGVDWIEFDVRATSDGRVVVSHDAHTLRTGHRPKLISRNTYATLRNINLKGGHTIPTIAEAFNAIGRQAKINVEIKTPGCAEAVVQNIERMVKNGASYSDFMVSSFKVPRLREVHRLNSKIALALLHGTRPYKFLKLKGLRVQAVGFSGKRLPDKAIHQAELRELMVYVYTINTLKSAQKFQERGVQAIVTNRPDLLQQLRD